MSSSPKEANSEQDKRDEATDSTKQGEKQNKTEMTGLKGLTISDGIQTKQPNFQKRIKLERESHVPTSPSTPPQEDQHDQQDVNEEDAMEENNSIEHDPQMPFGYMNHSNHATTSLSSTGSRYFHARSKKPDDHNPEANLYVSNFPPEFGEEQLREMFSPFGKIVRLRYVKASSGRDTYCLIQYERVEECQQALERYKDHVFNDQYQLKLSIVQRRTSSLSEEPTNLYVRNLPKNWNEEQLRCLFDEFGKILQCRIISDGIAFVRFDDHFQATAAIDELNGKVMEGAQLEVKFATRKIAAEHYKTGQTFHKENKNNLYIRFLPPSMSQRDLEELFCQFGKISSAKVNESGIAFVRYVHGEDAQKAIKGLNNKSFDGGEPLVVRLAYYDIGDPRNRLCVHIRNLPLKMTTRDVEKLIFKYGKASTVKVNEESGEAFARYVNADDAEEVAKQMNGLFVEGCSCALSAKVIYYDSSAFSHKQHNNRGRGNSFHNRGPTYPSGRYQNHGQHYIVENNNNSNISTSNNSIPTMVSNSPNGHTNDVNPAPVMVPQATGGNKYFTANMGVNYSPTAFSNPFVMTGSPSNNPLPNISGTPPLFNNNSPTAFEWTYPSSMWNTLNNPQVPVQFVNTNANSNPNINNTNTNTNTSTSTTNINNSPSTLPKLSTNFQNTVVGMPPLIQQPVVTSRQRLQTNAPPRRNYTQQQQKLGDQLYQYIKLKHPQYVAKLTGMILTMNEGDDNQIRNLLINSTELDQQCEKLVLILKTKQSETSQNFDQKNLSTQCMTNSTLQSTSFIAPNPTLMNFHSTTTNLDSNLLTTFGIPTFQAPLWSGNLSPGAGVLGNTNFNYAVTDNTNNNNTTLPN